MDTFTPHSLVPTSASELRRLEVLTRRRISSDLSGEFRSTFRGTGLTFSDLREYVPGDDVKQIHWRATARTGKAYVKTFEEDRSLRIHCALDISRSLAVGGANSSLQTGLELAALVCTLAVQNRDSMSLSLFTDDIVEFIAGAHSRHHLHSILRILTQPRILQRSTALGPVLSSLAQKLRRRSIVFIVSDFVSAEFEKELRYLAKRHDVIAAYLDPLLHIPNAGIVSFMDAENGRSIELDTSDAKVRAYIESTQRNTSEVVRQLTLSCGATFLPVGTNAVRALYELSRQRAKQWR